MAGFKFKILNEIGILSESAKGWRKELNFISWNDKEPKYDLRAWAPDHEKMGKGITLTENELEYTKSAFSEDLMRAQMI